jgi:hypothetical protein
MGEGAGYHIIPTANATNTTPVYFSVFRLKLPPNETK